MQLHVLSNAGGNVRIDFFDQSDRLISSRKIVQNGKGRKVITLDDLANRSRGIYVAVVYIDDKIFRQRLILSKYKIPYKKLEKHPFAGCFLLHYLQ